MVETLAGFGVPTRTIAKQIEISDNTLRKHYAEELELGVDRANAKVVESLFRKATGNSAQAVTAAIWWTKCKMGWSESMTIRGDPSKPVKWVIEHKIIDVDPKQLEGRPGAPMIEGNSVRQHTSRNGEGV